MHSIDRDQFAALLKDQRIKSRLARELRFKPEDISEWVHLELLAVGTRSGAEGLLLIQTENFYVLPYELTTGITDKSTGRSKPITCDLCYTWQPGGNAASITFTRPADSHTFTYLCCADLQCSLHVRNLTPEAIVSRSQLHEDITVGQRIIRLKRKVDTILATLDLTPAEIMPT